MKKLFSALLLSLVVYNMNAATGEIEYSYADENVFAFGKGKSETIDVAMCIDDPSLKGMRVKAVKAYVNTVEGISEASLWLSNNLTLENKVNQPDITSVDVLPSPAVLSGYSMGELNTTFTEEYLIGDDPLYVGYTITISETETDGQKYPIILSRQQNPNGLFLHMTKSVLKWMDYTDKANGVAEIIVTLEGNLPEYSLGIKNVSEVYAEEDTEFKAYVELSNIGLHPVQNFKYSYSFDNDSEVYSEEKELPNIIEPDLANSVMTDLNFIGTKGWGDHIVHLNIDEIDGHPNESTGSSYDFILHIIPFKPVHRPLVEEFTGLWCQYCTRGFIGMELLKEFYGDVEVSICYHNGDAMTVTNNYPVNTSAGLPCASIDRISVIDPYYGTHSSKDFGISIDVEERMRDLAIAEINVEAELVENIVNVKTSARFIQDMSDVNYQIGYVLVSNGLFDESWRQNNYYSKKTGYQGTYLEPLTEWPSSVEGLVFNDVAIDVSGMFGVDGSIPSEIKLGEYYSHGYSFDIENNKLVQDVKNLVAIVYVVNKDTGKIINANKFALNQTENNVDEIQTQSSVYKSIYYDLSGKKVNNPADGIFIKVDVLEDGSSKISKVYLKK